MICERLCLSGRLYNIAQTVGGQGPHARRSNTISIELKQKNVVKPFQFLTLSIQ